MESTISIIISIVFSTVTGITSGALLFFVKRFFKKKELIRTYAIRFNYTPYFAVETLMPGPMVEVTTQDFRY